MIIPMKVATIGEVMQVGTASNSVTMPASVAVNHQIPMGVAVSNQTVHASAGSEHTLLPVNCASSITVGDFPGYDGEYSFTPSMETQVINVRNKVVYRDITIDPIPSNYGLITWNGSTITVS